MSVSYHNFHILRSLYACACASVAFCGSPIIMLICNDCNRYFHNLRSLFASMCAIIVALFGIFLYQYFHNLHISTICMHAFNPTLYLREPPHNKFNKMTSQSCEDSDKHVEEAQWHSGRASDPGAKGRGFHPHSGRRVVSLSKIHEHWY